MIKQLRVTVDGRVYAVTVEMLDEGSDYGLPPPIAGARPLVAPVSLAPPAAAPVPVRSASTPAAGAGEIRSPLAGRVVTIDVKPGQAVNEGQQVATLEAMKMNTYIYAPKTGHVSTVLVQPGDVVEEGVVLLAIA
ncbi:MAG TPA: biotin/lipoyl-containing protein [Opitutaceae bacterium]|nr:biotin/lipoyl-containing protein [Opitutaceae bacterium]